MSNCGLNTEYSSHDNISLSDYDFKSTIGKGTFGKVKLAVYKQTNQNRAIKILNKKQIETKKEMHLVKRELNALKILSHPNLVHVNQIFQDSENYYIDMEYCENGELFDYIVKKHQLTENEASIFFYQLINAVEYIHKNKIAHRDLKPENLLLTKNKILKIIDFGLSNINDGKHLLSTKCGSPSYAAPEILRGTKYDGFKSDIWCCGIILFAMLSGYLPFEGADNKTLFRHILECKVEFPDADLVPIPARNLIKQILTPIPDNRITIEKIKQSSVYQKGHKLYELTYNKSKTINHTGCSFSKKKKTVRHTYSTSRDKIDLLMDKTTDTLRKKLLAMDDKLYKDIQSYHSKRKPLVLSAELPFPELTPKKPEKTIRYKYKGYTNIISPTSTNETTITRFDILKKPKLILNKFEGCKLAKKAFSPGNRGERYPTYNNNGYSSLMVHTEPNKILKLKQYKNEIKSILNRNLPKLKLMKYN